MNKSLNIIPTPQYTEYSFGKKRDIKKVYVSMQISDLLKSGLELLKKATQFELSCKNCADLIIECGTDCFFEDESVFENKYAKEQGYVIRKKSGEPFMIYAKTDTGLLYAVMTLLQIIDFDIDTLTVHDWPDFKMRGNNWLIWAETGIWSYDFGDGIQKIKDRIIRMLDINMQYKINCIYFDGFGLNIERFPEYSEIMRFANDSARKRGISLFTGSYYMSYGQQGYGNSYQGKAYKNRKSYPDGEVYDCIGTYIAYSIDFSSRIVDRQKKKTLVWAREHGTCLSNDELFKIKAKEICDYIKQTHCGGLYLHGMDSHEMHPEIWESRCDECRKRWSDDSLFSQNGAAGAFAYYIDRLANELSKAEDGEYSAKSDFHLSIISPGYTYQDITSDEDFELSVKFWSCVSKYITSKNVSVMFRENYIYQDKKEYRTKAFEKYKFNTDTSVINFGGADGYYSDGLFVITSAFNGMMKGFDRIITANGNSQRLPLQVFNAEYMWNGGNSGFYMPPIKEYTYEAFIKDYRAAIAGKLRPDEIYSDGGMLDVICEKLFGKECAKELSQIYALMGENGESPVVCACTMELYTNYNNYILPMRWDREDISIDEIKQMKERFSACEELTKKAYSLSQKVCNSKGCINELRYDVECLSDCFEIGAILSGLLTEYMRIYEKESIYFETGDISIVKDINEKLEKLKRETEKFHAIAKEKSGKPLDIFGGATARKIELFEFLDYQILLMQRSLETGKRIPENRKEIKEQSWW